MKSILLSYLILGAFNPAFASDRVIAKCDAPDPSTYIHLELRQNDLGVISGLLVDNYVSGVLICTSDGGTADLSCEGLWRDMQPKGEPIQLGFSELPSGRLISARVKRSTAYGSGMVQLGCSSD